MITIADAIFKDAEGKILLQFRDKNPPSDPLCFSFFGGSVEDGEAPLDAVIREISEELLIELLPENLTLLADEVWFDPLMQLQKQVYFYECTLPVHWNDFTVQEGAGVAFLTKEEITKLDCVSHLAKEFVQRFC